MEQQSLSTSLVRTVSNLNTVIDRETSKVEWEELDTTRAHCVRDETLGGQSPELPSLRSHKSFHISAQTFYCTD